MSMVGRTLELGIVGFQKGTKFDYEDFVKENKYGWMVVSKPIDFPIESVMAGCGGMSECELTFDMLHFPLFM